MVFHSAGSYESDGAALEQRRAPKIDPSSISITYAIAATIFQNDVLVFKKGDFYDSRTLLGEGATSTVFQTLIDPERYVTNPVGRDYRDNRWAIAIKQKRRRGSHIDPAIPLSAWLRACYSDVRVMSHRALASCENIVTLLGIFWEETSRETTPILSPCIVMPAAAPKIGDLEGLYSVLQEKGFLSTEAKLNLFFDITAGLAALHGIGVVHGDVKARNILIFHTPGPRVMTAKIADFTHSMFLADFDSGEYETDPDRPIYTGTRPFCIPEVRQQDRAIAQGDPLARFRIPESRLKACDIYGLGLLLLTILDFHGRDVFKIFHPNAKADDIATRQTLMDPLIAQPNLMLERCVGSIYHTDNVEYESVAHQMSAVRECFILCLQHSPEDRGSAQEVLSNLADTGIEFHGDYQRSLGPSREEREISSFRGSLLEFSYYQAQFTHPKLANIQQTQIFEEASGSVGSLSEGSVPLFLANCCAIGFGHPFTRQDTLIYLAKARVQGNAYATAIVRHVFDVLDGDSELFGRDTMVKEGFQELIQGWNDELEDSFADLAEPDYFRERVRRLKITAGPYTLKVRFKLEFDMRSDSAQIDKNRLLEPEDVRSLEITMAETDLREESPELDVIHPTTQNHHSQLIRIWDELREPTQWPSDVSYEELQGFRESQDWFKTQQLADLLFRWFGSDISLEGQRMLLKHLTVVFDREGLPIINKTNFLNQTPVARACQCGQSLAVKYLIENGADPKVPDARGLTCLHWLSFFSDDRMGEIASLLVAHGADVNAASLEVFDLSEHCLNFPEQCTPLHFAAGMRNAHAVRTLISLGADARRTAGFERGLHCYKMTALDFAICLHFYDLVEILLRHDFRPTVTVRPRWTGSGDDREVSILHMVSVPFYMASDTSPFARFVMHGRAFEEAVHKTIDCILKSSSVAKSICFDDHHLSTLFLGPSDDPYVLRALLAKRVRIVANYSEKDPPEVRGDNGWSLVQAVSRGSSFSKWCPSLADLLLDRSKVSLTPSLIRSILSDCAKRDTEGPLSSIFRHHLDLESYAEAERDLELFYEAVENNSTSVMQFLHDVVLGRLDDNDKVPSKRFWKPEFLNPPQAAGFTPLHLAATVDAVEAANLLIGWGADLNIQADRQGSPLCIAAQTFDRRDVAVKLLRCGASVYCNTSKGLGYTVLHAAVEDPDLEHQQEQQFSMVRTLIESCASRFGDQGIIDAVDSLGSTALHRACYSGDKTTVETLLSMGANLQLKNALTHTPFMAAFYQGTFRNVWREHCPNKATRAQSAGWTWVGESCLDIAAKLKAAGSPLPPTEPVTGEFNFILQAAVKLSDWEGVSQEACFGVLTLPNLSRPGMPAAVGRDERDPNSIIFFNPVMKGRCLVLKKDHEAGQNATRTIRRSSSPEST